MIPSEFIWIRIRRSIAHLVALVLHEGARKAHHDAIRQKSEQEALDLRRQADALDEVSKDITQKVTHTHPPE